MIPVCKRRTSHDGTWNERGKLSNGAWNTEMVSQVSQKEYDNWKGGWDAAGVLLKGRDEALDV